MGLILSTFSGPALLHKLLVLIVVGFVFYLLWFLISKIGLPEPFAKVTRALILIAAVIYLINFLLGLIGAPLFSF